MECEQLMERCQTKWKIAYIWLLYIHPSRYRVHDHSCVHRWNIATPPERTPGHHQHTVHHSGPIHSQPYWWGIQLHAAWRLEVGAPSLWVLMTEFALNLEFVLFLCCGVKCGIRWPYFLFLRVSIEWFPWWSQSTAPWQKKWRDVSLKSELSVMREWIHSVSTSVWCERQLYWKEASCRADPVNHIILTLCSLSS